MSTADLSGSPQALISLASAAKRLCVSYRQLRDAVRSGELPAYHVGGQRCRVLWGDVVHWIRRQRAESEAAPDQACADPVLHVTIRVPPIVRLQVNDYFEEQRLLPLRQRVEDFVREELAREGASS